MDLRSLRLLLALAEHRHFARAAEACGISQPAFSARIQNLEQDLGVRLVERGARFERFTDAGERMLPRLREIAALTDAISQDAKADAAAITGHLRIAVIPTQLSTAGALAAVMRAAHVGIQVSIQSRSAKAIDAALDQYEADIGLSYADGGRPERFATTPLVPETYVLVATAALTKDWPDAPVSWIEAAALPLALLTLDMQNRRILDETFAVVGVSPSVVIDSDTFTAIMGAVRSGAVATILPEAQAASLMGGGDLRSFALTAPVLERQIGLYALRREPQLPVVRAAFAAAAKQQ
jgi:DNA-binding transcriptional LysR family regulator